MPYEISNIQEEVRPLFESGLIRSVAFLLLRKDKEGRLSAVEGGSLQEEEEVIEINALLSMLAVFAWAAKRASKLEPKMQ